MGYESRIFIVEDKGRRYVPEDKPYVVEIICSFNLCKVKYDSGLHDLFYKPCPFAIFAESGHHETQEDRYGDHIKYSDFDTVIKWCEEFMMRDNYRRIPPFLAMLKGFDRSQWNDLKIVHYGY